MTMAPSFKKEIDHDIPNLFRSFKLGDDVEEPVVMSQMT
jgi:hypothetical protein